MNFKRGQPSSLRRGDSFPGEDISSLLLLACPTPTPTLPFIHSPPITCPVSLLLPPMSYQFQVSLAYKNPKKLQKKVIGFAVLIERLVVMKMLVGALNREVEIRCDLLLIRCSAGLGLVQCTISPMPTLCSPLLSLNVASDCLVPTIPSF